MTDFFLLWWLFDIAGNIRLFVTVCAIICIIIMLISVGAWVDTRNGSSEEAMTLTMIKTASYVGVPSLILSILIPSEEFRQALLAVSALDALTDLDAVQAVGQDVSELYDKLIPKIHELLDLDVAKVVEESSGK